MILFLLSSFLIISCSRSTPPPTPQLINVYVTPAAQAWLQDVYTCAPKSTAINLADAQSADVMIRIGEPTNLTLPAYQIDKEDILIVTHRQSLIQNMTLDQVRALFAGQGDPSVQVWVYASGEDIQQVFDQAVMKGRSVTSLARLAVNLQQMSDALVNQSNAAGILPKHWKVGDSRIVFSAGTVPVLVLTKSEPQGAVKNLISCLQAK